MVAVSWALNALYVEMKFYCFRMHSLNRQEHQISRDTPQVQLSVYHGIWGTATWLTRRDSRSNKCRHYSASLGLGIQPYTRCVPLFCAINFLVTFCVHKCACS
ncbi:unnamed protein product [Ectocarpus sp. 6 AP-2014]